MGIRINLKEFYKLLLLSAFEIPDSDGNYEEKYEGKGDDSGRIENVDPIHVHDEVHGEGDRIHKTQPKKQRSR